MKTLPILAALVAVSTAILVLPFGFEATVSVLFGFGLVAILVADYAHVVRPLRLQLAPVTVLPRRREHFRLAA